MGRKKAEKSLKETVEEGIMAVLKATEEPSDGRIKALALGIKMVALNSKLDENSYGEFFDQTDAILSGETKATPKKLVLEKPGEDSPESS